jgi:hypothetical protein
VWFSPCFAGFFSAPSVVESTDSSALFTASRCMEMTGIASRSGKQSGKTLFSCARGRGFDDWSSRLAVTSRSSA